MKKNNNHTFSFFDEGEKVVIDGKASWASWKEFAADYLVGYKGKQNRLSEFEWAYKRQIPEKLESDQMCVINFPRTQGKSWLGQYLKNNVDVDVRVPDKGPAPGAGSREKIKVEEFIRVLSLQAQAARQRYIDALAAGDKMGAEREKAFSVYTDWVLQFFKEVEGLNN